LDGNTIDRAATAMQTSLARQPANMFPSISADPISAGSMRDGQMIHF
jgi:hypothetical protein